MRSVRMTLICCLYYIRQWAAQPRTYVALIMAACVSYFAVQGYWAHAKAIGEPFNLFEPYILLFSSLSTGQLIYIALLFMFSDAPFMRPGQAYYMLRIGRRLHWFLGQMLYIAAIVVLSMAFVLAFVLLLFGTQGYTANIWSVPYYNLTSGGVSGTMGLTGSTGLIEAMTPSAAALHTFALGLCYCLLLALLLYFINLRNRKVVGFGVLIVLQVLTLGAQILDWPFLHRWLPFSNALLTMHAFAPGGKLPTVGYSYLYFGVAIVALGAVLIARLKKQDMEVGDLSGM